MVKTNAMRVPPPPPRRRPPPPPPPRKKATRIKEGVARRHVRRVTLNIIRLSAACPDDLRPTLEKLHNEYDYHLDRLTPVEQEYLFATVTDELGERAKDEFQADTESITDHRGDNMVCCELCGHQHIRFEFTLVNTAGGTSTKTGSTCIETYGLNVDGSATADEALKALRRAISAAKQRAECEDWQKEHPDHAAEMEAMRRDFDILRHNHQPWDVIRNLKSGWLKRCKSIVGKLRTILSWYDEKGFLTEIKTKQWGVRARTARSMVEELKTARAKRTTAVTWWDRFLAACPKIEDWERRKVEYLRDRGIQPSDVYSNGVKRMVGDIHIRNGRPFGDANPFKK